MLKLLEESVTLPPDLPIDDGNGVSGYPLYITAKRYFVKEFERCEGNVDAVTVLALHSTSFHKEVWEPTLEALFELVVKQRAGRVRIREVWVVDCPNHGRAGVLNREVLKTEEFANDFSCDRYADAVHRFLTHAPERFGVDFGKRKLIGLGHSLGANAILLLQGRVPSFPFLSLIIVEPMLSPDDGHHLDKRRASFVESAKRRTFEWADHEAAFKSLKRATKWDERVLRVFVKHALHSLPSGKVTLACTPEQEVAMYLDREGATKPTEDLNRSCSRLPVHLILGLENDYIPRNVHDALLDPASGRRYASVTQIADVGHLIPQQEPDKLGRIIYEVLLGMDRPTRL